MCDSGPYTWLQGVPLYITESGLADSSEPDNKRLRYLVGVLQALRLALDEGIDIRGYTMWCAS